MRYPISLGRNCDVAFQLRMHGPENVPHFFDWLGTPADALMKVFDADFDVFHPDDLTLITDRPDHYVMDRATGIVFFHQFPFVDGRTTPDFRLFYAGFIKVFTFYARKFKEYVTTSAVTLVRRDITFDEANALEASFFRRFPGTDVEFLYLVHDTNEFHTAHGHARYIPRTPASLGEPTVWVKLLAEEGLISKPYCYATAEILGASHSDHNLSPDDRFNEQELLSAIAGNPDHFMFPLELSAYYRARGLLDKAEVYAARSLELAPDNAAAMLELILIGWKSRTISASEAADSFIELTKRSQISGLLLETAASLLEANRIEEAILYSDRAIRQNPLDHNIYYTRAMSLYAAGNVAAAERAISGAISLNSGSELYFHLHGRFLDELGMTDEAIAAEQRALVVGGGFHPLAHLGELMARRGRSKEALDYWYRALPLSGENCLAVQGWIDEVQASIIEKAQSDTPRAESAEITP